MPISKAIVEEVMEEYEEEGEPELLSAPLVKPPAGLPPSWADALSGKAPLPGVRQLWAPVASRLPKTMKAFGTYLKSIGLLRTKTTPLSLIYCFKNGEDEFTWRGWPPGEVDSPEASKLAPDFIELFESVHDGFTNVYGLSGPRPSAQWTHLTKILPDEKVVKSVRKQLDPDKFLVVLQHGNTACLGFDLRKSPPAALEWEAGQKVQVIPDLWEYLDETMDTQIGEILD